ncbi:olfactory receptor 5V1-like [Dendrobates tinctorius]|uniref:olfactory receptor 5V1-like n=1 Tax=Dendrobates tinctorius TaxID=92724 RepID=UPI003CCA4620
MIKQNETSDFSFNLMGFSYLQNQRITLFLVFFLLYLLTILGNTITIFIICMDLHLHTPMYLFISQLSFVHICNTCVTIPKMLINIITKDKSISFAGCVSQLFIFSSLGTAECALLGVMAYDRYLAICSPLRYMEIMGSWVCMVLASVPWLSGFVQSSIHTFFTFQLFFCQPRNINSFYCDVPSLLKLSCSATYLNEIVLFCVGGLFSLSPFLLTFVSYTLILEAIFQISSSEGRSKAFSTCGSHLTVLSLFYGATMLVYFRPTSSYSLHVDRLLSVFYTLLTPLLNPIIYSLKNNEVREAMRKIFKIKEGNLNSKTLTTKNENKKKIFLYNKVESKG